MTFSLSLFDEGAELEKKSKVKPRKSKFERHIKEFEIRSSNDAKQIHQPDIKIKPKTRKLNKREKQKKNPNWNFSELELIKLQPT